MEQQQNPVQPKPTPESGFSKFNNWARNSISLKFVTIGFLILILLIPTAMIQSLIREREYTQQDAIAEVSSKWGNFQTVTGPVLTIPYTDKERDNYGKTVKVTKHAHFLPEELDCNTEMETEQLHRGIYDVVVYNSKVVCKGMFLKPNVEELARKFTDEVQYHDAFIAVGIPDLRGIQEQVKLNWNGEQLSFDPGIDSKDVVHSGISVKVPLELDSTKGEYTFSFELNLNGSEGIYFVPMGKETNITVESAWADPSFDGAFLPDERAVSEDGFSATWKVLHLNRNFPQQWLGTNYQVHDSSFGVNLRLPVDQYQKTTRSAKYGILIIALTFLVFFFVEILNKRRIHPIQYLLVGLGLSIFYTLLLSLSEHINFNGAYLVAGAAVVLLVTGYSYTIFKALKQTGIMFGVLVALYIFIYTLLQLQDFSLLMGSIGLFLILGMIMFLSRKINWYGKGGDVRE